MNRLSTARRTCDLILGVGDGKVSVCVWKMGRTKCVCVEDGKD